MKPSKIIANNVRTFRRENSLSQSELAEACNLSVKQISEIERGITWPREETILALAKSLGTDPSDLLFDDALILKRFKKLLRSK